jgi:dihydrofolate reductase
MFTPLISAVVAMAENRVIGADNKLPWHLPADLKHFKAVTTGHPVIMGRKTYESIGKPLPLRTNIIVTRDSHFKAPGCLVAPSLIQAFTLAKNQHDNEIFIIGGAQIYQEAMPFIQRIYLTLVHHTFEGDTYFPLLEPNEWVEKKREDHEADSTNAYSYSFVIMDKKTNTSHKSARHH